ncbi:MAG: MotA/TolQ/ExbB proton channel family protein [Bacteroidota bacterium]
MSLSLILLQAVPIVTDTAAAVHSAATGPGDDLSVLSLLVKGGPIMFPIGFLSFVALFLFIERWLYINRVSKVDPNLLSEVRKRLFDGNIKSAIDYCAKSELPVARMIEKGLMRMGSPIRDIESAIENTGRVEIYKMEKNLSILSAIAAIAPMFGFLGTVMGMIKSFYNISISDNISIGIIAEGIYEKMITSASGLIVGVLAYIFFTTLSTMIDRATHRMELAAVDFMDLLHKPVA